MTWRSFRPQEFAAGLWPGMDEGAIRVLALRLSYVGLEFLSALVLARLFKASTYGSYALAMAIVGVLAVPASSGFDRMLIREVATLQARQQWSLLHGLLRRATQITCFVSVILALAAAIVVRRFFADLPRDVIPALLLGLCVVPVIALARVRLAGLQGLGHVVAGQLPEMLVQPLLLLVLAITSWLLLDALPAGAHLVALHLIAAVTAGLFGLLLWLRHRPDAIRLTMPAFHTWDWIAASVPFAGILALGMALMSLDTIIVGWQLGPASAGIYRVSSMMAMLVGFPLTAVNMVAAPRVAALHALGDLDRMRGLAAVSARQILLPAILIWVGMVAFGKFVLGLFGADFPVGYSSLMILATSHLLASAAGIAGYTLIMTGHEKETLTAFGATFLVCAIGNVLLVPRLGLEGAAFATGVSLVVLAAWLAVLCRVRLGVRTFFGGNSGLDAA